MHFCRNQYYVDKLLKKIHKSAILLWFWLIFYFINSKVNNYFLIFCLFIDIIKAFNVFSDCLPQEKDGVFLKWNLKWKLIVTFFPFSFRIHKLWQLPWNIWQYAGFIESKIVASNSSIKIDKDMNIGSIFPEKWS